MFPRSSLLLKQGQICHYFQTNDTTGRESRQIPLWSNSVMTIWTELERSKRLKKHLRWCVLDSSHEGISSDLRLFSFKLFVFLDEKNKLVVCHGKLFAREFHSDEKMSSCFTRVFGLGLFKIHFVWTNNSLTRLPKTIDVRSNKGVIN